MKKLASRKLWITIGSLATVIANYYFEWDIPPETGAGIAVVVASYLLGQSWVDKQTVQSEVSAAADVQKLQLMAALQDAQARLAKVDGVETEDVERWNRINQEFQELKEALEAIKE